MTEDNFSKCCLANPSEKDYLGAEWDISRQFECQGQDVLHRVIKLQSFHLSNSKHSFSILNIMLK